MNKKLLWVGDAACPSGFAKSTHYVLDGLRLEYDVTVLGLNYRGDPHAYPYPIYAAAPGGDALGVGRLVFMCDLVKPDVVVLQNDPWNIPGYVNQLRQKLSSGEYAFPEHAAIPLVGIVAVDGVNCMGDALNGLSHAIFWTEFGQQEARAGGFKGFSSVVSLGVDQSIYKPKNQLEARKARRIPDEFKDVFIVGNVNRNQLRKRWDLTLRYFARWIKEHSIQDAYLYLHTAPTGDWGCDIVRMAKYYDVLDRVMLVTPSTFYGAEESEMCDTYNCFDVQLTTTQGEGFGLTTFEGMACGVPQIVPDWSALGELCKNAAMVLPCPTTYTGTTNVIGGVMDEQSCMHSLQALYENVALRKVLQKDGLKRVREPRFDWVNVSIGVSDVLQQVLAPRPRLVTV
jgi:glycosyltransferase involved in cell wall biosynthesis